MLDINNIKIKGVLILKRLVKMTNWSLILKILLQHNGVQQIIIMKTNEEKNL